jgi:hypothetical protein
MVIWGKGGRTRGQLDLDIEADARKLASGADQG